MILVKTYYNTNADGSPVSEDVALEDMPCTYHGPFEDLTAAIDWMDNVYPDGDTDVFEQIADDFDIDPDSTFVNAPDSLFGDTPDEDIRDETDDIV